jgi:L,D-transpeptidase YcbB
MLSTLVALLAAATFSVDCPPPPAVETRLAAEDVAVHLEGPKPAFLAGAPEGQARWRRLQVLYAERDYEPLWPDRDGALQRAWAEICASPKAGLALGHYLDPASPEVMEAVAVLPDAPTGGRAEALEAARREADVLGELRITDTLLTWSLHQTHGRVRPARWQVAGPAVDEETIVRWAAEGLASPDPARALASLSPTNAAYRQLVEALRQYRRIAEAGGWPAIPGRGVLQKGDRSAAVVPLRERLAHTGDLPPASVVEADRFDDAVEEGVRRFQARHGLVADGVVGPRTRAALSVPVEARIRQMQLNLERRRWMHDVDLGHRHVWVNVPSFEVHLVEAGRVVASMRAVIGTPTRQTPTFSDRIQYLEVNPVWWVPESIVEARIIPRASANPDWLRRMGFELRRQGASVDPEEVDWAQAREKGRLPYAVRQRPGPANAMGQVKFMFPNRHLVYLHDTPDRHLFERPDRAFSFGCVRVEAPEVLLDFLLEGQHEAAEAARSALEGSGGRQPTRIDLEAAVPVHLVYFTAWVDEAGRVQFRDDVYGRDRWLARHLDRAWPGWD